VLDELSEQWEYHNRQLKAIERRLVDFAATAPSHEA